MQALKGTKRLIRLAVRRDRIKLPIWIGAILALGIGTGSALMATYNTETARLAYASTIAPSAVGRMFGGSISGASIGEIFVIESFLWVGLGTMLMNIFLIIRHTRQHEEQGQSELIGSFQVGRQASVTAALVTALSANAMLGLLIFAGSLAIGLPITGSAVFAVGIMLLGMMFAGISAITAQLTQSARSASGLAGITLGIMFIMRAIGDGLAKLGDNGISATSSWISWLSPIGWIQQSQPFGPNRWWVFGYCVIFIFASVLAAYWLLGSRDIGSGLFAARNGKANASRTLLSPFGLIWRLHHTAFIAWLVGIAICGATIGGIAPEFRHMIEENPRLVEVLKSMGGSGDYIGILFSSVIAISAITLGAFTIQMILRLRGEETEGRTEAILATPLSRVHWSLRYILYTFITTAILLVILGVSTGLTYGILESNLLHYTGSLTSAALAYLPPALLIGSFTFLLVGVVPKLSSAIGWSGFAFLILISQFGVLLKLPAWVINISPFSHIPSVPAASLSIQPLAIEILISLLLLTVGLVCFRRRDIITS